MLILSNIEYYNKLYITPTIQHKITTYIQDTPIILSSNIFKIYNQSDNLFIIRRDIRINNITEINPQYLNHLSQLSSIPKILHVSWPNKNVLNSNTKVIKLGLKSFVKINPLWKLIIYDDNDIEQYIKSKLTIHDYNLIKNKHIVEKVDLWRLLIIYFKGGLYADIDRLFTVKMDDLIDNNIKMILPTHYNVNFAQDLMCSAPFNKLFKLAIELNISKRRILSQDNIRNYTYESHFLNVIELGPQTYWESVTKCLFDILMDDGGDRPKINEAIVSKMRNMINDSKLIKTYKEQWCDTIVYHTDDIKECKTINKMILWAETNHKFSWDDEMRK
eukprot:159850_1